MDEPCPQLRIDQETYEARREGGTTMSEWNKTAWAVVMTATLGLSVVPRAALAQSDVFAVNYYANANTGGPDAKVRITNPGTAGAPSPSGDLCALIYVFTPDQQMAECCGCKVTPNGLLTLSVQQDLTSNALTGVTLTTGAIKLVSSTASKGVCDGASPTPTPALIAWATHLQRPDGSTTAITETPFEKAALSTQELTVLQDKCGDIEDNGSGHGVCTCGSAEN
jgi:hypothetical protein